MTHRHSTPFFARDINEFLNSLIFLCSCLSSHTSRFMHFLSSKMLTSPFKFSTVPTTLIFRSCRSRFISSSQLLIERTADTTRFDRRPPNDKLTFGGTVADHMLMVEWNKQSEWGPPRIVPYQDLKLDPAASCLHYGK